MSLFGALSLASQALLSNKVAINSTTKNINNAYTEGYSREEPIFIDVPSGGVSVKELRRVFNVALFKQYIRSNQERAFNEERYSITSQVEDVFNDAIGSGFGEAINKFFSSLHDIALNPGDIAARESFLGAAQTLVGRIRQSYSSLEDIGQTYYGKLRDDVGKLNKLLKELSEVNRLLPSYRGSSTYNQYIDNRDRLIKEISSLIDVKFSLDELGRVNLYTAKGFALVLGDRSFSVKVDRDSEGIKVKVQGVDISSDLSGGSISGTLRGLEEVEDFKGRLNKFTSVFAKKINDQHKLGYDLDGNKGENLFSSDNGEPIDASNIVLSITDPKKVAAASSNSNLNADNGNVLSIIDLGDERITELGELSFSEFYGTKIVSELGVRVSTYKSLFENSDLKFGSISEKFKELSGVNVDEEMVKLTQFQRAYQAAARVITVSDELLETVLSIVR